MRNQAPEKKSGIELLSHSQICSTIVAGPLIDRVRDGNVSYKPAMDTGKKGLKMLGLCRIVGKVVRQAIVVNWEIAILYLKTQLGVFFVLMSWQTLEGKKGGQASRPVSNAKLKALLPLHVHPIELVVFKWSSGIKDPGTSHLQGGLALRCFQRLSFPDVATQRCLFRDNWNTRGQSFPVLSY